MKNVLLTKDDDLTLDELEAIASDIHTILTHNKGLTIPQFKKEASNFSIHKLGYRNLKTICEDDKLEAYFPDEVFNILKKRCKEYFGKGYL